MLSFGRGITAFLALSVTVSAEELAPSCADLFKKFGYKGDPVDQTLLVVLDGKLVDVNDAIVPPKSADYQFHYVYKNSACAAVEACVEKPAIAIKTMRATNYTPPQVIFLSREASEREWSIGKAEYDSYHSKNYATVPPGPLNNFHISFRDRRGEWRYTHDPKDRRRIYLFVDIPTGFKPPWLKVRNYQFASNPGANAQCIPFTVNIPLKTEFASIDVIQIEDGEGGIPQKIQRWELKFKAALR